MKSKNLDYGIKGPKLRKGEFLLNFPKAISEFENSMQKFPVKKILYRAIFRGKGLEFDSYREFSPMDDASLIDWRASLRANELLARKYVEERELNIYFLVDVSNSMLFGSGKKLKAEYSAELIASLSHLIIGAGDRIGLVMFNEDVVKVIRPSSNRNQFSLFAKSLSDPKLYGGGFSLDKAIEYSLGAIHSPYTVFIIVSDFIRTPKNSIRNLKLLGSRFETLALMVRDPMDERLPNVKYQLAIQDPYSGRQMVLDPSIASEKYERGTRRQKAMLREMFRSSGVDVLELFTDKSFAGPVSSFLKARSLGSRI